MKIAEYPAVESLSDTDSFIVETGDGTRRVEVVDMQIPNGLSKDPVIVHRNTYRGKNLGTEFTLEQQEAIRTGTFEDLYVGDYWVDNNTIWRIVDIDYFKSLGEMKNDVVVQPSPTNTLIVMPDNALYKAPFNTTVAATVGYNNSSVHTTGLTTAKTMINSFFGSDHIANNFRYISSVACSAVGSRTINVSISEGIELPCASQIIEHPHFGSEPNDSLNEYNVFSALKINPLLKQVKGTGESLSDTYLLANPYKGSDNNLYVKFISENGTLGGDYVSTNRGVRPFAILK